MVAEGDGAADVKLGGYSSRYYVLPLVLKLQHAQSCMCITMQDKIPS